MADKRGFYEKYRVERIEGEEPPGARYFVLRIDSDQPGQQERIARLAAVFYATNTENQPLAWDLIRMDRSVEPEFYDSIKPEALRRIDHLKALLAATLEHFDPDGEWHKALPYEPWVFEDQDHVGPLRRAQAEGKLP